MQPGRRVGAYQIERELGRGGMGAVYVGKHTLLGRPAAIKVLQPRFTADPEVVNRFFNEAKAATAIRHAGIVEVFDFGYSEDGAAFIVMELCEGESLAARLERRANEPLELLAALGYARQIAAALAAAHKAGIVHRDLKPDNVFLVPDDEVIGGRRVKLLDFGIAKLVGDAGAPMVTNTGAIMGTPLYMSPEQCRGAGKVDHRADLYSLGCILFEMVCGRVPFIGEGPGEILGAHLLTPPPSPRSMNAALPVEIEAFILALLAKKPDDRPQTADAIVEQLRKLAGTPITKSVTVPLAAASSGSLPAPERVGTTMASSSAEVMPAPEAATGPVGDVPPAARRSKAPLLAIGGIAVAGGIVAVVALAGRGRDDTTVTSDAAPKIASVPADAGPPDAAPPPQATPADAAVASAPGDAPSRRPDLTTKTITEWIFTHHFEGIRTCHNTLLQREPDKEGDIVFLLRIEPDGRVTSGTARGFDSELDACIQPLIRSWTFPATDAREVVTHQVTFRLTAPTPRSKPPTTTTTAPPTARCDPQRLKELRSDVENAIGRGAFAEAVAKVDQVLACGPDAALTVRGFLAACNSRDAAVARRYFAVMSAAAQSKYVQICARNGIEVAPPPRPAEVPAPTKKSLSADDYRNVMAALRGAAAKCYRGVKSTAGVDMTIAPSGTVTKVTVIGVFAGTSVGTCIENIVRGAVFSAWDGPPQTFSYSYLISDDE